MTRFLFYLQYALRNVWRNRRWSFFAVLSVAAGVATIVALRSLGLAIGESLTTNVRAANKGDIAIERASGPGNFSFGSTSLENLFDLSEVERVAAWAAENDSIITTYSATNLQIAPVDTAAGLSFMTGIFIDPTAYPLTGPIPTTEPRGSTLGDLLQDELDVVISDNLAAAQNLSPGDQVVVTGTPLVFTVRGIVNVETEAGLRDPFAAVFGFAYFRQETAPLLGFDTRPNRISVLMPDDTSDAQIIAAAETLYNMLVQPTGFTRVLTVPSLLDQNEFVADAIGRFIVIMGLGAMLIGGVSIINTMLVLVRRRTNEIAALKTFGLKGRQVAALFMTEALVYGVLGSMVGSVLGLLLSRFTNSYGETFLQQSLPQRFYPEALVFGLVLGIVVTAVFGVMPVLTAVKVRPGIILRPNDSMVPVLGVAQSLGVVLFVVLALGLIAGQIIGPFPASIRTFAALPVPQQYTAGVLLVAGVLLLLAAIVIGLWAVVWLISRLPAFGWVDLQIALRNLGSRRLRTATTLLAISTGVFAISTISFYSEGVREVLQVQLADTFGGNVLIISPSSFALDNEAAENAQDVLDDKLDSLGDDIIYRTRFLNYDGRVNAIDDLSLRDLERGIDREQLFEELNAAGRDGDFSRAQEISRQLDDMITPIDIAMRLTNNPNLVSGDVAIGRDLTAADIGQPVAVVLWEDRMQDWGLTLGSELAVEVQGSEFVLEVVGLIPDTSAIGGDAPGNVMVPFGTLGDILPNFQLNSILVPPDRVTAVEREIATLPFFFPINVRLIDGIVSRVIDQFSALPLLVATLSLVAAGVIMANTVALATFERRRQIGILKAVGLKRRRVLTIMLLENLVVSVLGAVIGIGSSVLTIALLTVFGLEEFVFTPSNSQPVIVALVIASVAIGLIATFASANAAARERVLNALRYE